MEARFVFLLCVLAAATSTANALKIQLWPDRPSLRLTVSEEAAIKCCYICSSKLETEWIQSVMISKNHSVLTHFNKSNAQVDIRSETVKQKTCSKLLVKNVTLKDTGLYQCALIASNTTVYTPGTYLQVYEPIPMVLGMSERTKNSIITAEGVLLLLFVLLPGTFLICKSKGVNELERKKKREEENIYEGLNLDDCNSTYHQIQRSLVQGPYQDVINNDDEDIQLEKP